MVRTYTQTARKEQTLATRQRILDALYGLFDSGSLGEITLQGIADAADVSLRTVTRHFSSKEELLRQAMAEASEHEESHREVPPGDLDAICGVLAGRYEEMAESIYRMGDMELTYPWLSDWVQNARESHLGWLADAFEPWLPAKGREREDRLMCLFSATEIRSWWAMRHRFGLSPSRARAVMRRQLEALTNQWGLEPDIIKGESDDH